MEMTFKNKNIIALEFDTQEELASSFIRLQEFYESPYPEINGNYFTLDHFKKIYTYNTGKQSFTYLTDWSGFNIPGHVVSDFILTFIGDLSLLELKLLHKIPLKTLLSGEKFYIIGYVKGDALTYTHELAHAFYYLNECYKDEMDYLINKLSQKQITKWYTYLESKGYYCKYFYDEIQAYNVEENKQSFARVFNFYLNRE